MKRKEDTDSKGILAGIPLVVLDVSICYWILTNLQATMRALKVRRNIPKLTLYRHFTNTLVFCVIGLYICDLKMNENRIVNDILMFFSQCYIYDMVFEKTPFCKLS